MTNHSTSLPLGLRTSDLVTAAATGLLSLPDPARRTPLTRFALRSAVAGTTGALVWLGTGEDQDAALDLPPRLGFTVGAVGLVYGAAELGEAIDSAFQRRLVRAGVRRPRLAMALAGAGLSLAMSLLERRTDDAPQGPEDDDEQYPTYREVPARVRDLVAAILAHTEDYDALRLRAQLAVAREERWGEEDGPERFVELDVPDDVPLAVPRSFTFPVSAQFTSSRGVPCLVQLFVEGGRLRTVLLDIDGARWGAAVDAWDPGTGDEDPLADVTWPALEEVTIVAEETGRAQTSLP